MTPFHKRNMSVLFMITMLMFQVVNCASTTGNETDYLALMAIKTALRDQLGALNSWNHSTHHCYWEGITCGHRHQRVVALDLSSRGLSGSISPYIGNLSFLHSIDVSNNTLEGSIPAEIGSLSRLSHIFMFKNLLIGEIPPEFSSLSLLKSLGVSENHLGGQVFNIIQNLTSLEVLSAANNSFEGIIPDTIGQMKNLALLELRGNLFTGTLPSSIYNLSSIRVLSLGGNDFHGSLPPYIESSLPNLQFIEFAYNHFTGPFPAFLLNISTLIKIDLLDNKFTGSVPWNLGRLKQLQWLQIGMNFFGSGDANDLSFINSMVNCTNLTFLGFSHNYFRGVLPNSIANQSTRLETLKLDSNGISGRIPSGMGHLTSLVRLIMDENELSGTIPSDIGKLQNLEAFGISQNRFTGVIPESFGNLSKLSYLLLFENHLQGYIPSSLGKCQNLNYMYAHKNNLRGMIPKELFEGSPHLVELTLSNNHLEGTLPFEVGKQRNLVEFDVAYNNMSGDIPSSIGSCVSMLRLYLQGNMFLGSIPPSLGYLESIQELDLSHNNLSGPIPTYLSRFPLSYLNLSYNNYEGEVPVGGVFANTSTIFLVGNEKLCGGIPVLHLPRCTTKEITQAKISVKIKIIISCSSAFVGVAILFFVCCIYCKRRRCSSLPIHSFRKPFFFKVSYEMLLKATQGFSSSNLIGVGTFGSVFKGVLEHNQMNVAVKVLNLQQPGASKSFVAECDALRNVRHRNLVRLMTACSSIDHRGNDFKALVYEYMHGGNLEIWLHGNEENQYGMLQVSSLSLLRRVNIALDVAYGLEYLHHDCGAPMVHCDLKPSNILLDDDMVAHVGDFGLAKLLAQPLNSNHNSSTVFKGTIGYAAPELGLGSDRSAASDIYSYGIVVLEMMTRKRPTDDMFKEELNLHTYVKMSLPDEVVQIVDNRLLDNSGYLLNSVRNSTQAANWMNCVVTMMKIGVACTMESPQDRMSMKDASLELLKIKNVLVQDCTCLL